MGFFSSIFKKKQNLPAVDLSVLKTDVHSHFIPAIDDGSQSMQETLDLLQEMVGFGYKKVITTPHIMGDFYKSTPEIILGGLEKVRKAIKENNIDVEIEAAAEYYLDDLFEDRIKTGELLTFGDKYLLFELPFISEPPMLDRAIFEMQTNGYRPVLAHPERYTYWYNDFDRYEAMRDKGVHLQLNINSLSGQYPPDTKKMGERLVEAGMITFLGSDCHNMNHVNMMHDAVKSKTIHDLIASGKLLNDTL
ncbi:MAG: histidinol phosphatase [Flavobacteriales bacterium]|nr:histidinol phosphatase [Flavobacteriales bacterium]